MYERLPEVQDNMLAFMGHGMTQAQMNATSTTDYLDSVVYPTPAGQSPSKPKAEKDDDAEVEVSKKISLI